ncbi:MAG TPA: hypothetical protein VL651_13315 [Bacteroidia bacterium]|jgi:hypothetical protein|nr:hypothetical protein [Bacteroidia bacterium]
MSACSGNLICSITSSLQMKQFLFSILVFHTLYLYSEKSSVKKCYSEKAPEFPLVNSHSSVKFDSDSLYLDADLGLGYGGGRLIFDHQLRFGYERFVIGTRYTSSFRKDIGSYNPDPWVKQDYYRKLKELAVYGGYRFWEKSSNALSIVAGPVWRNDEAGYWYSKGAGSEPFTWSGMMKDKSRSIRNQGVAFGLDYLYSGRDRSGGIDVSLFLDVFQHSSYSGVTIDYRFGELR